MGVRAAASTGQAAERPTAGTNAHHLRLGFGGGGPFDLLAGGEGQQDRPAAAVVRLPGHAGAVRVTVIGETVAAGAPAREGTVHRDTVHRDTARLGRRAGSRGGFAATAPSELHVVPLASPVTTNVTAV
jgi:hypothetical protein